MCIHNMRLHVDNRLKEYMETCILCDHIETKTLLEQIEAKPLTLEKTK